MFRRLSRYYQGLLLYYELFGLGGVWAAAGYLCLGRPAEIRAQPRGIQHPFHVRIDTSDAQAYKEVVVQREYAFDLPFAPKTIVDAGANIGAASVYFANRYPEARIIAIEPEASNFEVLRRNTQPYPQITPLHAALWNRDGEIAVGKPDFAWGGSGKWAFVTHEREGGGDRVPAMTMQTLMSEMDLPAIDLLKVDIEGAEQEVFQDSQWLNQVRCLMIELHDRFRPGCTSAVEPALREFVGTARGETWFYLRKTQGQNL